MSIKDTKLEEKEQLVVHGDILADGFRDRATGQKISVDPGEFPSGNVPALWITYQDFDADLSDINCDLVKDGDIVYSIPFESCGIVEGNDGESFYIKVCTATQVDEFYYEKTDDGWIYVETETSLYGTQLYKHLITIDDGEEQVDFNIISNKKTAYSLSDLTAVESGINYIVASTEHYGAWYYSPTSIEFNSVQNTLTATLCLDTGTSITSTVEFGAVPTITDTIQPL